MDMDVSCSPPWVGSPLPAPRHSGSAVLTAEGHSLSPLSPALSFMTHDRPVGQRRLGVGPVVARRARPVCAASRCLCAGKGAWGRVAVKLPPFPESHAQPMGGRGASASGRAPLTRVSIFEPTPLFPAPFHHPPCHSSTKTTPGTLCVCGSPFTHCGAPIGWAAKRGPPDEEEWTGDWARG